jgi:hypothetical protein
MQACRCGCVFVLMFGAVPEVCPFKECVVFRVCRDICEDIDDAFSCNIRTCVW